MDKNKQGWKQFVSLCQEIEDEKLLSTLFDLLLTSEERDSIAMRCLIIQELLNQQRTQRDIAKYLNVSISKITRGSNEIKRMKPSFIDYLKQKLR